ncbi:hypothetical protein GUITHDRAFT_137246 [Guillardia theta CCMP2712]|uniref:Uncharacterized protein n=1 Tax=Guillardia theta (strain CCMP2712) TaxID=905079 RepID=L1JHU5_GUITC|nr:hypothetical protein GUITHDRAFT_137246 [Guillardia theta CCMP2712]EKX47877.1 hypothetical protein GUITHDRAFT_137246 [Guillardia theta CCMP2712]|eukprot:XP_005834857.1 hypothetical protein GUITHDRAFT_137246 [Guillardia theta CCMP2712]
MPGAAGRGPARRRSRGLPRLSPRGGRLNLLNLHFEFPCIEMHGICAQSEMRCDALELLLSPLPLSAFLESLGDVAEERSSHGSKLSHPSAHSHGPCAHKSNDALDFLLPAMPSGCLPQNLICKSPPVRCVPVQQGHQGCEDSFIHHIHTNSRIIISHWKLCPAQKAIKGTTYEDTFRSQMQHLQSMKAGESKILFLAFLHVSFIEGFIDMKYDYRNHDESLSGITAFCAISNPRFRFFNRLLSLKNGSWPAFTGPVFDSFLELPEREQLALCKMLVTVNVGPYGGDWLRAFNEQTVFIFCE